MKKITDSPTVNEVILLEMETTPSPLSIDKVVLYHIERDFGKLNNYSKYVGQYFPESLEKECKGASEKVKFNPSKENLSTFELAKLKKNAAVINHAYYFKDANPVFVLGTKVKPAWKKDDDSQVQLAAENIFTYEWDSSGVFEGEYFLVWHWTTETGKQSSYKRFHLGSDKNIKTAKVARYTPPDKYEMLLKRYTPEMYKRRIKHTDLTPAIISRLNSCIAQGFTQIEDMANNLMDALDGNLTHEGLLPMLASFFNLQLRSNDSTLWRRQIRSAIPLFKAKGTIGALGAALDQAGIRLLKVVKLWQVVSQHYWTDGFVIKDDSLIGTILGKLSKKPIGNLEVSLRSGKDFMTVPEACINLADNLVIWTGSKDLLRLFKGDIVKVRYNIKECPPDKKSIEDYINSLPLMDQRNELKQEYPRKNWNAKVIEDDDPLFDVVIGSRHPFHNPVVYGKIRTNFLFSENTYNMDSYNGSLRDSNNYCDIDKDFLDSCSYCQSSKFNIYLEIDELSDEKIMEARNIIKEYVPFHATLHSIKASGSINEIVPTPVESIETSAHLSNGIEEKVDSKSSINCKIIWKSGKTEEINYDD